MVRVLTFLARNLPYLMSCDRKESLLLEGLWDGANVPEKCSDIKESESTAGDLSTVPTGCCRLCMRKHQPTTPVPERQN
ncbi:hypothetical protein AVEN_123137-1 [Araneus ventricosus]|uniref:Uncharacterized protein n=1 Tax=Araneus ventricosus TaxID=182803 RepID=A0A4Y2GX19_ARAVE|nr:hypothetical protein AVEN_123137-1 [Araneus ventricosus]